MKVVISLAKKHLEKRQRNNDESRARSFRLHKIHKDYHSYVARSRGFALVGLV